MPPLALISSIQSSAAALPGTPNTEAGPEVKVVMPSFSSAGLVAWEYAWPTVNRVMRTAGITRAANLSSMITPPKDTRAVQGVAVRAASLP